MSTLVKTYTPLMAFGEYISAAYEKIGYSCMSYTPWLLRMFIENPDRFAVALSGRTLGTSELRVLMYRDVGGEWMIAGCQYGESYTDSGDAFHSWREESKQFQLLNNRLLSLGMLSEDLPPIHLDALTIPVPSNRAIPYLDTITVVHNRKRNKLLVVHHPTDGSFNSAGEHKSTFGGVVGVSLEYSINCDIHDSDDSGHECRRDPLTGNCGCRARHCSEETVEKLCLEAYGKSSLDQLGFDLSESVDAYGFEINPYLKRNVVAIEGLYNKNNPLIFTSKWMIDPIRPRLKATRRCVGPGDFPVFTTKDEELSTRLKEIHEYANTK